MVKSNSPGAGGHSNLSSDFPVPIHSFFDVSLSLSLTIHQDVLGQMFGIEIKNEADL